MANIIKIKNTGTASATPNQLEYGELAINYADGKLFYRNSANEIAIYGSSLSLSGTTYSVTIGDGTTTSFTLTHNLGTRDIFVSIRSATSPYDEIEALWEATSTTDATIKFDTPPVNDSVRVSIYAAVTGDNISLDLNGLTDVSISSATPGQVLKYNGSAWINDIDDAGTTINSIGDIGDVLITGATPGQIISWDGSQWINANTVEDLIVQGDLTVNGITTTINTQNLLVEDNLITLNSNAISATTNAGIEVYRGSEEFVPALQWNEMNDKWEITTDGTNYDTIQTETPFNELQQKVKNQMMYLICEVNP